MPQETEAVDRISTALPFDMISPTAMDVMSERMRRDARKEGNGRGKFRSSRSKGTIKTLLCRCRMGARTFDVRWAKDRGDGHGDGHDYRQRH